MPDSMASYTDIRRPSILLVDPDAAVLHSLKRVLETNQAFWEIHCANSGEQALRMMERRAFDVVVTELVMPGMSGLSLLFGMARESSETVRIVHTSHTETLSSQGLGRLAQRILPKPSGALALLEATSWALRNSCARDLAPGSTRSTRELAPARTRCA